MPKKQTKKTQKKASGKSKDVDPVIPMIPLNTADEAEEAKEISPDIFEEIIPGAPIVPLDEEVIIGTDLDDEDESSDWE